MESSPKTVLVALSGGCESVACLYYGKSLGYNVHAFHVEFSNSSSQERTNCIKICDMLKVPLHEMSINYGDATTDKHRIVDTAYWTSSLAWLATRKAIYDEVWFGIHNQDSLPFVGRVTSTFDLLVKLTDIDINTKISSPLWKMSKKEQYDMIDVDIQSLLVYCSTNKMDPCGECDKCLEWKSAIDV